VTESPLRRWWWPVSVLVITLIIGLGIGLAISPDDNSASGHTETSATAVDIGFAQDMSAHHQQAVMMADMVPLDSAPDVRGVVDQIQAVQSREIGQMTGWLQMLDAPLQSDQSMSWMKQVGHSHTAAAPAAGDGQTPTTMPGSASGDELTALHNASGVEAEILFLQLMIRHHQGGIDMAAHASQEAANPAIRRAATGMVKEQSEEIGVMTVMLNQRGGQPLPYPA
jgi:uncharacterized protein (DUF305 family)